MELIPIALLVVVTVGGAYGIVYGIVYLLRLIRWIWLLPGRLSIWIKGRPAAAAPAIPDAMSSTALYAPQRQVVLRSGTSLASEYFHHRPHADIEWDVHHNLWDTHDSDWNASDIFEDDGINPASGLPMVGMVDTEGNLYGSSGHDFDDD